MHSFYTYKIERESYCESWIRNTAERKRLQHSPKGTEENQESGRWQLPSWSSMEHGTFTIRLILLRSVLKMMPKFKMYQYSLFMLNSYQIIFCDSGEITTSRWYIINFKVCIILTK
jgi:hypothetical protein